jgi:2-polyprenyl-6-methoxyphenol hydroxylase-like FAD-dependent oxidoreductase
MNLSAGPILIVGAGIGGLTTAIALRQANRDVEIFERAPELKEVGAGIALSPNAMRLLKRLGLMQPILDRGTAINEVVSYTSDGRTISRLATNMTDVPSVCLHRADLQEVLFSALPRECVHFGEPFADFSQTTENVTARFASGRNATGDALIGADGLRSAVRSRILGDGAPVYRGYQCWRGVCSVRAGEMLTETLGPGIRMGVVPLGRRGTAWWCCANQAEFATDEPEGAKPRLMGWLENWHQPIPEVLVATDAKQIIKTGIYDRRPIRKWSHGRCTLLGDAAHPATPNIGQGGCMAIEDAVVLARCITGYSDLKSAFRAYEHLRYTRTAHVTRISRSYGKIGQWKHPVAVWFRSALLRFGSGMNATKSYRNFVDYDAFTLEMPGSGQ